MRWSFYYVDNVFVLYAIVQRHLLKKLGKVYVCFVDFKKAFDMINMGVLWSILRKAVFQGKFNDEILQDMYKRVRSCVPCPNDIIKILYAPVGFRQGCVLSTMSFSF